VVEPNRKCALHSLRPEAIAFVVEEFAPPSLSILAIGDRADPNPLPHRNSFANVFVLDACELRLEQLARRVLFARTHQTVRARKTANMFGAVWRLRISHDCSPVQVRDAERRRCRSVSFSRLQISNSTP